MKSKASRPGQESRSKIQTHNQEDRVYASEEFYSAFNDATSNAGSIKYYFRIGKEVVCFCFAGDSLAPYFTRALAHLAIKPVSTPDLTINLWDSESGQRSLPGLFERTLEIDPDLELVDQIGLRGEVTQFSDDRFCCSLQLGPNILTLLDKRLNRCVYWINSAQDLPHDKIGSPLRSVLHWWFSSTKRQLIHAGAVGTANGGVLLAGEAGAGKSTTALNCVLDGLFYAGDDYVLVDLDPVPLAHAVFQTAKVKTSEDIARFGVPESWLVNSAKVRPSKPMLFIGEQLPEQIIDFLPLKAIVFPRFVPGETVRIDKILERDSFCRMVPSNIKQIAFADTECMRMLAELARRLPSYRVTFGEDQKDLSKAVIQIIDKDA